MKDLGQSDGIHGGLSVLLGQVDHAWSESHLDLDERLVAVRQEVLGLPAVDPHHAKQQVARGPECHLNLGLENAVNALFDVGLEDVGLGELLVPVGSQPDPGEGALLGQDEMGVKHLASINLLEALNK